MVAHVGVVAGDATRSAPFALEGLMDTTAVGCRFRDVSVTGLAEFLSAGDQPDTPSERGAVAAVAALLGERRVQIRVAEQTGGFGAVGLMATTTVRGRGDLAPV